jgi:hypothetical protein
MKHFNLEISLYSVTGSDLNPLPQDVGYDVTAIAYLRKR